MHELSEYEQLRLANMERNKQVMIALGLMSADVTDHEAREKTTKTTKTKKRKEAPREGTRRSKRLAAMPAEEVEESEEAASPTRRAEKQRRGTVVGTASYEHTLMRVRSMSDKALWTRMRKIETAQGRHAVVKMRLFGQIAFLEKKDELAEACVKALGRLVALLGDTPDDDVEPSS